MNPPLSSNPLPSGDDWRDTSHHAFHGPKSQGRPFPIAIGIHIKCLCGKWHKPMNGTCEAGNDAAVWAAQVGVKKQKLKVWRLIDGELVRTRRGKNRSKGYACVGYSLRSYNAKARLYGMEVLAP